MKSPIPLFWTEEWNAAIQTATIVPGILIPGPSAMHPDLSSALSPRFPLSSCNQTNYSSPLRVWISLQICHT